MCQFCSNKPPWPGFENSAFLDEISELLEKVEGVPFTLSSSHIWRACGDPHRCSLIPSTSCLYQNFHVPTQNSWCFPEAVDRITVCVQASGTADRETNGHTDRRTVHRPSDFCPHISSKSSGIRRWCHFGRITSVLGTCSFDTTSLFWS